MFFSRNNMKYYYRFLSVLGIIGFMLSACGNLPIPSTETAVPMSMTPTAGAGITPVQLQVGYGVRGPWFELYFTDPANPLSFQGSGGVDGPLVAAIDAAHLSIDVAAYSLRSEERRVGKECRSRWSPYH